MPGCLYVAGTPIGNLADASPRLREVLESVEAVLCEDTRVTAKLCAGLKIRPSLWTFQEYTDDARRKELVAMLVEGKSLALVSDAGTPAVSDPGTLLVREAAAAGVKIVPIPGPSAVTAALSVCGFWAERFTFVGFPPHKKGRESFFKELIDHPEVLVLFESTHRIVKTLEQLAVLDRKLMVGRELTKLHETIYRGSASEVIEALAQTSAKGEFVIVVDKK